MHNFQKIVKNPWNFLTKINPDQMVVLAGSLRCGILSICKYLEKYHKVDKEKITILPYLLFEPEKHIHQLENAEKVLIILRNPTDRAFSLWKSNLQNGLEWLDFENAIAREQIRFHKLAHKQIKWRYLYFRGGLYSKKIKNLRDLIGNDEFSNKVQIIPFDQIMSEKILKKALDIEGATSDVIPQLNKSKIPANSKIQFTVRRIFEIFSEEKIRNTGIKNLLQILCKIVMDLNIKVQDITNLNRIDKLPDTKGVYDFLKHAYKEDIEILSEDFPQFQIWLKD